MQWLIDLVKEWIIEQGYISASYVDRGDPAAYDFTQATLTQDNAWHDLDLSAIVPAGTRAVNLNLRGRHSSTGKELLFRANGNVNYHNASGLRTVVGSLYLYNEITIALDSNRIIEYKAMSPNWTNISISVKGWYL